MFWEKLEKEVRELIELKKLSSSDSDAFQEIEERAKELERVFTKTEFTLFLSEKYDKGSAVLTVSSGAGGVDAQDWASMLFRMYERYAESHGYETKLLHHSFGDRGGTKSVTFEVKGKYAYGYLKGEYGVHRLVRISPFSSQSLRHTSFALVEVVPEVPNPSEEEIEIRPEDLRFDTFRASGPGGQYVNRRESAIRIHHIPTGIAVACQSERLQGENKESAMKVLAAKLYLLKLQEKEKELARVRGKKQKVEWGSQIRSYVLHPYKLVKDLRTGMENHNPDAVLDGNLDMFIEAEIRFLSEPLTARE